MSLTDPELWTLIQTWPLPGSVLHRWLRKEPQHLSYAQSLAEDYNLFRWNAEGVEVEYRRWLYLCATQGRRMQGSDWMENAERQHRKDTANWQGLMDGPLQGIDMGDPVPRSAANDSGYAETLALYKQTYPEGAVFLKVWPATWEDKIARSHAGELSFGAIFGGVALVFLFDGWGLPFGLALCVLGFLGIAAVECLTPWRSDDQGY
jgi:hypothetical protein